MSEELALHQGISRRGFLKMTAAAGVAAAGVAGGLSARDPLVALGQEDAAAINAGSEETLHNQACFINCNSGHCAMKSHVREGKIYKVSTKTDVVNPEGFPIYHFDRRPCLRGRSHVQMIYDNDRIKYPLRRKDGTARGAGEWERISWDDAIAEIAEKFTSYQKEYGNQSVALVKMWGNNAPIQGYGGICTRFLSAIQGTWLNDCLDEGSYQGKQRVIGNRYAGCNSWWDVVNAKTLVIWATNVTEVWVQTWYWAMLAHERGTRLICIDPRYSITASKCDKWIPIKQGTDSWLLLGAINYILTNDLYDKPYMIAHTVAPYLVKRSDQMFLREADIMPAEDVSEKNVALVWDEETNMVVRDGETEHPAFSGVSAVNDIALDTVFDLLKAQVAPYDLDTVADHTGLNTEDIIDVAMAFANKPCTTWEGMGLDRYNDNHIIGHARAVLTAITGNFGIQGGGFGYPNVARGTMMGSPAGWGSIEDHTYSVVPWLCLADVLDSGTFKGKPFVIKALLNVVGNGFSNHAQQKEFLEDILPKIDFVVTHDLRMTDTARYSDIVLPSAHYFEDWDYCSSAFIHLNEKAIDPLYEAKSNVDFLSELGTAMGFGEYFTMSAYDVLKQAINGNEALKARGENFDTLLEKGSIFNVGDSGKDCLWVHDFAFPTASGKLEIYQENPTPRMDYGQEIDKSLCRLPVLSHPLEAYPENPDRAKYPLVMYQEHSKWRVHSFYSHIPWLRELDPEPIVKMNPRDAESRGISEGDTVRIYNDRGSVTLKAFIDNGLQEGMCNCPKGWQRDQFIDGGYQELTSRYLNPVSVNQIFSDVIVEIEKVEPGE